MSATIIDGRAIAARLRSRVAERVSALSYRPGLAVLLVGEDPASAIYVRNKDRAARQTGISAQTIRLGVETQETDLLAEIERLNADPAVDAILVQLPLPGQIRPRTILEAIDPAKDVDGFHPLNVGRLADGLPVVAPCTPRGVIKLLQAYGIDPAGKRALVAGRSAIVGKPTAALLLAANATVTIAHSHTRDLPGECRRAEILVAAIGRRRLIQADWLSPGVAVIDVGVSRLPGGELAGDVDFEKALDVAGWITPVPGGVGLMTVAVLLQNTVIAARRISGVGAG